jgi:exopolysaccharide biosynthesis protein
MMVMQKLFSVVSMRAGQVRAVAMAQVRIARLSLVGGLLGAVLVVATLIITSGLLWTQLRLQTQRGAELQSEQEQTKQTLSTTQQLLVDSEASLAALVNQDQFKRNQALQAEITNIQRVYKLAVDRYEALLTLRLPLPQSQPLEKLLTGALLNLSKRNYTTASAQLAQLDTEITKQQQIVAAIPANVQAIQAAPGSGYRRQQVTTDHGTYLVDIIAADLNSTRVQVETASDGDCRDNCPVASLSDYISRSGGFAGVNGPYFCPAEYPSCAGKTNSFDTLMMNKKKTYFNSDNNVYSVVPAVIFSGNGARFVGKSQEWGRDTGVDAVIAAQPMLLSGGDIRFGGSGDPKQGSKGSRAFIGTKDNTVYIGVVRGATVAEVAIVLKAMGLQNALNLDSGGSTALFANGKYIAGPGRNTPFGIVLVRK